MGSSLVVPPRWNSSRSK